MNNLKRYLISSAVTFFSTFFATLGMMLQFMDFSDGISVTIITTIVIVASRIAVKSVWETITKHKVYTEEDLRKHVMEYIRVDKISKRLNKTKK